MANISKKTKTAISTIVVMMIGGASFLVVKNLTTPDNDVPPEESLIQRVSIQAIVADTTDVGTVVTDSNRALLLIRTDLTMGTQADSAWQVRLKIELSKNRLDALSPDRSFAFEGTRVEFRGSDLDAMSGFNFELVEDTLEADFRIPAIIPGWNWQEDPVALVVTVTDKKFTGKASLVPISTIEHGSITDERRINNDIYNQPGEKDPNKFTGEFKNDKTHNGLTNGTDIEPDKPELPGESDEPVPGP